MSPIKKVCRQCHSDRLRGDMYRIMARRKAYDARMERNQTDDDLEAG
jgi:hypothetical protein